MRSASLQGTYRRHKEGSRGRFTCLIIEYFSSSLPNFVCYQVTDSLFLLHAINCIFPEVGIYKRKQESKKKRKKERKQELDQESDQEK